MVFLPGQLVKSKNTGLTYHVLNYDWPDLDGREVVVVRSTNVISVVFPMRVDSLVPLEE